MNRLMLNAARCTACGLCSAVCGLDVITCNGDTSPTIHPAAFCNECGHCIAICPRSALSYRDGDPGAFAPLPPHNITADQMASFLLGKRSCRVYANRPVEKSVLAELIEVARTAPTAINCQERAFIVVTDPDQIAQLCQVVVQHTRSILALLKLATGKLGALLLPPETYQHLRHVRADFTVALRHWKNKRDVFFHNAPCLIFFAGIRQDPVGRDHALLAMTYLMLYAETMGLGTCINGYAQAAAKQLTKLLDVPQAHAIYGAITLGYARHTYRKQVYRKPALVVGQE